MTTIHKTKYLDSASGLTLHNAVLSDGTVDAYDDVVDPSGIDCTDFMRNPVALLNHNKSYIIGKWLHPRVENGALRAQLQLVPEGTSVHGDEVRKLLEHGFIKGVSIGFAPISSEPRPGSKRGGLKYSRVRLIEASIVSVPANPNALLEAKSLAISSSTIRMLFKDGQAETLAQKIERAKRIKKRALETIARVDARQRVDGYKPPNKSKPKLLTDQRARASTKTSRELLAAKEAVDRMMNPIVGQLNKVPPKGDGTWRGTFIGLQWRGQPIPTKKWRDP